MYWSGWTGCLFVFSLKIVCFKFIKKKYRIDVENVVKNKLVDLFFQNLQVFDWKSDKCVLVLTSIFFFWFYVLSIDYFLEILLRHSFTLMSVHKIVARKWKYISLWQRLWWWYMPLKFLFRKLKRCDRHTKFSFNSFFSLLSFSFL